MPYDPEQLDTDVETLMQQPGWQDPKKREDFIRNVAVKTRGQTDPETHAQLIDTLWKRADDRGVLSKTGDFVKRGAEEVLKSIPASGAAVVQGVSDVTGLTDSGSQSRITGGVKGLVDATGQRLKQLGAGEVFGMNLLPGVSRQKQRDDTLQALKKDLDSGAHPAGFEDWLAGAFDDGKKKPDAETQQWIDGLTKGLAQRAVAADHMGEVNPAKLDAWLHSDRNPARVESDITGMAKAYGEKPEPGPREYLADYLVTRDPKSWEAFQNRVTETDAQYRNRIVRMEAEAGTRDAMKQQPDGLMKDLTQRGMEMQTSPIDLASAVAPVLRGSKALQAAKAGGTAAAVGARVLKGAGTEALQEGGTEFLQDPRASGAQVAEAAGLGAVGSAVVEGTMAGTGAAIGKLTRPKGTDEQQVSNDQTAAAPGAGAATNPAAPMGGGAAEAGGPQTIGGRPVLLTPKTAEERVQVASMGASTPQQRAVDGLPPQSEPMSMADLAGATYTGPQAAPAAPVAASEGDVTGSGEGSLQTAQNAAPGNAGALASVTPEQASVTPEQASVTPAQANDAVELPVNQGRARMAEKILPSQGVQPDVAAVMGARLHESLDPALDAETFRQRVLGDFEGQGGVLPGSVANAYVEDAAAYVAQGYTPEQAAEHAANAKTTNDATRAQIMQANKGLLKKPEAVKDPEADSNEVQGLKTQEVPLSTLSLSKDVPQFKSDANDEGVVEPLAGKYERLGTGPVLIWERTNGKREVISGRHRFDLAKRTGEKTIPGQIVREADGFTLQHALTADAELNIRDGHGKTKDFANYFRHAGLTDTEAESRGLRARAAGRAGWAIGTQASQAVFDLHQNGKLTDAQAEALAATAPNNEALQRAGVLAMNRGMPIDVTVNLLKAMQLEVGAAPSMGQMDLFGADDSAMVRMEEQARKATEIQRGLKEQVAAVQGAAKRPDKAKALGVNVKDPAAVLKRVNELRAELYRWESWPLHADLREQVRGAEAQAAPAFGLQSTSPEQLAQEQAAAERKAALTKKQEAPLKGDAGEYGTPDMLDNTAGDMALFNQGGLQFVQSAGGSTAATPGAQPVKTKSVYDALKLVVQKLPWLQHGRLLVFQNGEEFLNSGYTRPQSMTPALQQRASQAAGFYDTQTGFTVIIADNIVPEEGETPIRAAARVLMHERVGHEGVNALMAMDPVFAERIGKLADTLPDTERIRIEFSYPHLEGDKVKVALEWLAQEAEKVQVERNAATLDGGLTGLARQLWQAIKETLLRFYANFSRKTVLQNEVNAVLKLAQAAARAGTADPTSAAGLVNQVQFSSRMQTMLAQAAAVARGEQAAQMSAGLGSLIKANAEGGVPANRSAKGVRQYFTMPSPAPVLGMMEAYQKAMVGSSTGFVPISKVYEHAAAANPGLTPEQFMAAVQTGDNAGALYLEVPESKETLDAAGPFVLRMASGVPATNMMVLPGAIKQLQFSSSAASTGGMASNTGAAQNAEPSPGGLSEAEARTPMTIYRAGDSNETGVKPWASFTPDEATAKSYTDNPGFGGSRIRTLRVDAGNVLDLTGPRAFQKLAAAIGYDNESAQEWKDNGWNYPWEESSKIKRALQDSEYDSVKYTDDFPAGATTIIFTRSPAQISPSFKSLRAEGGALQFSLGGTRIRHAAGTPYRVNDRAWRAILTGSALPRAFTEAVEMTERERKALDQRTAQVGNDLKAAVESYAERSGQPLADVYAMVNDTLSGAPGTNAVMMQVDPVLHQRSLEARALLDALSTAVAQTLPVGDLRNTIMLNQGAWMKRSYAAFDAASGWNFDNVMQAARDGRMLGGRDARAIVRTARAFLQQQNPQATAREVDADMRDLMDRDTVANAITGAAAVRQNITSLLQRRDIPVELRELMGEEKNPIKRFGQSTSFQAQLIHRYQQQLALRQIGLQGGLFQTERGGPDGVFTQQIPADNRAWSGLNGLWTTPQLWQAMQNLQGANTGTELWSHAGEALKALGNEAKLNRVAMNPDSWMVNALGNVVALVQTGDVFYFSIFRRVREAAALQRSGRAKPGDVAHNAAQAVQDAQRAMVARLTASGVLGQNFNLRDLEASVPRHLLAWVNEDQARDRVLGGIKGAIAGQAAGRGFGVTGRVVGGAIGAAVGGVAGLNQIQNWQQTVANYVMTGPDAMGRLTGFLGNLETAHAAGMQGDAAYAHAVDRTRNTFPDYGRMPEILKTLSRYGVAGSFIGFQYEVYRNTIHNLRYAWQDIRSGNPALVERGIKRTIGAAVIGSLVAGGMQAIFQGLAGADDERNKKWRKWFGAPWEKNGVLVFTNYGDKSVSYFNTSYLVPQATLMELVNAAASGKDPMEAAGNVTAHVWEQFMGSSVHLGPIISAVTNTDRMGRPLTYEKGAQGIVERIDAAAQTVLEPGWAAKMERLEYAMREAERKGRLFSVEEEIKRLVGVREFTRSWHDMVKAKYNDFATQNSDIRAAANRELGVNLPGAKGTALTRANAAIAKLDAELKEYEADLKTLGVPDSIARAARKESSIPRVLHKVELDTDGRRVKSIGVR